MTNATTPAPVRLLTDYAFFAEDGSCHEWAMGEVVYDANEIATLQARSTAQQPLVEPIDAAFIESAAFTPVLAARCRRLGAALAAAALVSASIAIGPDYTGTLAAVNNLDAVVRTALDRFIDTARRDIAALMAGATA